MSSIETLEDRAAPSDSIGAFLGLGLAAEFWPMHAPSATPLAAELSLAASSSPIDEFIATLAGTGHEETSNFDVSIDPTVAESMSGVRVAAARGASDALAAAGAQLVGPLPSPFGGVLSTSALDRTFVPVGSPAPDPANVRAADRAPVSAVPRVDSAAAHPKPLESVLNTAGAQLSGGRATSPAAGTALFAKGAELQPEGDTTGRGGTPRKRPPV